MRKIISLFQRNYDGDRLVRDEIVPGAEWVGQGDGVATRKMDGTCCLVKDGKLYKRYEVKPGGTPPEGFVPANGIDENTGKQQGWLEVTGKSDEKWHIEAWQHKTSQAFPDGTYELLGPKIQGNPENIGMHVLIKHSEATQLEDCPRDFEGIKDYLNFNDIEGIVWHHPDGRMVKIKTKDFGLKRGENPLKKRDI